MNPLSGILQHKIIAIVVELVRFLKNNDVPAIPGAFTATEIDQYKNIFIQGVKEGSESNLLQALFHVRTGQLFKTLHASENYHYLSGLLIGSELKGITSRKINAW